MVMILLEAFRHLLSSSLVGRVEKLRARRMGRGYGIQLRGGRRRESRVRVMLGFMSRARCVSGGGRYVLHVISFEENICFSFVGISARDARVAVDVVYHHTFLVFGQRSVQENHDGPISQRVKTSFHSVQKKGHTAYLCGRESKGT
jgi:hypothetical protein